MQRMRGVYKMGKVRANRMGKATKQETQKLLKKFNCEYHLMNETLKSPPVRKKIY